MQAERIYDSMIDALSQFFFEMRLPICVHENAKRSFLFYLQACERVGVYRLEKRRGIQYHQAVICIIMSVLRCRQEIISLQKNNLLLTRFLADIMDQIGLEYGMSSAYFQIISSFISAIDNFQVDEFWYKRDYIAVNYSIIHDAAHLALAKKDLNAEIKTLVIASSLSNYRKGSILKHIRQIKVCSKMTVFALFDKFIDIYNHSAVSQLEAKKSVASKFFLSPLLRKKVNVIEGFTEYLTFILHMFIEQTFTKWEGLCDIGIPLSVFNFKEALTLLNDDFYNLCLDEYYCVKYGSMPQWYKGLSNNSQRYFQLLHALPTDNYRTPPQARKSSRLSRLAY